MRFMFAAVNEDGQVVAAAEGPSDMLTGVLSAFAKFLRDSGEYEYVETLTANCGDGVTHTGENIG